MAILALTDSSGVTCTLIAPPGETLSRAIWLSGLVKPRPMCAGLALCGKCRLRFISEAPEPTQKDQAFFAENELAQGWRLGCQHNIPENRPLEEISLHVQIPVEFIIEPQPEISEEKSPNNSPAFLGIDLGTTSIAWQLILNDAPVEAGEMPNPQAAAGADIISRLQYAQIPENRQRLASLARTAISGIIQKARKHGMRINRACIAANTAMTEILLNKDISGLCSTPLSLSWQGGEILPFPPGEEETETVFPPLPAPFIGGDTVCGLLYLLEIASPRPFFLADLGTNAELALFVDDNRIYFASIPLGPALEGIGPACGHAAAPGVISSFRLSPAGLTPVYLRGQEYTGICATGYLALIRILRNLEIISPTGHFANPDTLPSQLSKNTANNLIQRKDQKIFKISKDLFLAENDIEQLLKVRAALRTGINYLLQAAGLSASQIAAWFVAGATGTFATEEDLKTLGLPANVPGKLASVGNSSLYGACMLAQKPDKLPFLSALCKKATIVELTSQPHFAKAYLDAMRWEI